MSKHSDYHITPIRTLYNGRQYRSRLEAKWAAFFDSFGWQYEYEPFDLQGWSPDFILKISNSESILVEVKPSLMINNDLYVKMYGSSEGTNYKLIVLGECSTVKVDSIPIAFSGKMPGVESEEFFTHNGNKYPVFVGSFIVQNKDLTYTILPYCDSRIQDGDIYTVSADLIEARWNEASNNVMFLK